MEVGGFVAENGHNTVMSELRRFSYLRTGGKLYGRTGM
jgi:hypothetical protein